MRRTAPSKRKTAAGEQDGRANAAGWSTALGAAAVAAALLAFGRAIGNGFVWDDPLVLRQLRAFHGLSDLFVVPAAVPRHYYRPVIFASYLFDLGLGRGQPSWFHASVVAWHMVNTLLVFLLARRLFGRGSDLFAGIAALLFAVHPVHVESVAWMAGRSDVIACALALAALLVYLSGAAGAAWLAAGILLLSFLAKESVIPVVTVFPLADRSVGRSFHWRRAGALAAAVIAYIFLRYVGIGLVGEPIEPGAGRLSDLVFAYGFYTGKALLPVRQTVYASAVPRDAFYLVLGLASAAGVGTALLWAQRRRQFTLMLSLGWFVATLAPALLLVLRRIATTPIAERYLYIPSVGAVLALSYALGAVCRRTGRNRLVLTVSCVIALIALGETARRTRVWSDDLRFWTAAAQGSPSALPQRELGDAYVRRGKLEAAEQAYRQALALPSRPEERAMTLANLGNLYRRQSRVDDAVASFKQAAALARHPLILHGLGFAFMRQAEQAQAAGSQQEVVKAVVAARRAFEQAIELGSSKNAPPAFRSWEPAKTHLLLGQVLASLGDREGARREMKETLRLEPAGLVGDTARKFMERLRD